MATLTVYFDAPWWVGVVEREEDGALRVVRYVFGSEPGGAEVLAFVQREYIALVERPSVAIDIEQTAMRRVNPKRLAREAAQATQQRGVSTKSQEVLRLQQETAKREREVQSRERRETFIEYKRQKAREKAYAKRRGH